VAEKLDASVHAVWRVLRREGIYLQRRRSWCVSTDKEFAPKAAEVVGLYLNPPLNAVVPPKFSAESTTATCPRSMLRRETASDCFDSQFPRQ